jgi:2,3-bisphosphoglycerate-dependent phosphoglycerate mutase
VDKASPVHARLVLVRHGESESNAAGIFTGWSDPPLTTLGAEQAIALGHRLAAANLHPARAFSSVLLRCTETTRLILGEMKTLVPVVTDAALNERDYGSLTGMNKRAASERFGRDLVREWRRSYAVAPPDGESLRDTAARVLGYYVRTLLPAAMEGGTTLVVSHGNSLRALAMALDGLDAAQVESFDLLNGATLVYDLSITSRLLKRTVLN